MKSACFCVLLLACLALLDSALYGRWVLPLWSFLRYNIILDYASSFGVKPWHWYLSEVGWAQLNAPLTTSLIADHH